MLRNSVFLLAESLLSQIATCIRNRRCSIRKRFGACHLDGSGLAPRRVTERNYPTKYIGSIHAHTHVNVWNLAHTQNCELFRGILAWRVNGAKGA